MGIFSATDTSYSSEVNVGGLSFESIGEMVISIVDTSSGIVLV